MPCKVGKGKSRGKNFADISAGTNLWRNLTPRAISQERQRPGGTRGSWKALGPRTNVSILKSPYNNQHSWQRFPIPFLFLFPKQQSGNGASTKKKAKEKANCPTKEFKKRDHLQIYPETRSSGCPNKQPQTPGTGQICTTPLFLRYQHPIMTVGHSDTGKLHRIPQCWDRWLLPRGRSCCFVSLGRSL